jgi:ATP-dependent DNA ligase
MLARLAPSLPHGRDWVYEPKWDGFRGLLVRRGESVRILSRNGRSLEPYFPELVSAALKTLLRDCSVDREILAMRGGKPDFSALLTRLGRSVQGEVCFMAFDLLNVDGEDRASLPLLQRRSGLLSFVPDKAGLICTTVQTNMRDVAEGWLTNSHALHLEGVVAKKAREPYRRGYRAWIKVKAYDTADLVVGGLTWSPSGRVSLLLGAYDDQGALVYVGRTNAVRVEDIAVATREELFCDQSFAPWPKPGLSRWDSHRFDDWQPLQPVLVCEVSFSRIDGHFLRHSARFIRWRPDKNAAQCTLSLLGDAAAALMKT